MEKQPRRHKARRAQTTLTLPELDQSKNTILNSLGSLQSRRSYRHAMDEFIAWYCSEPRLALTVLSSFDTDSSWRASIWH
jgi:hypothetical protein